MDKTYDINIKNYKNLEPPKEFLEELPITSQVSENVTESREIIKNIISGKDKRLLIITGPCSIHDEKSGIEYAEKLVGIKNQIDKNIYQTYNWASYSKINGWKVMRFITYENKKVAGLAQVLYKKIISV